MKRPDSHDEAPGADSAPPRHILFVCTGNLCRSPMAEYLLRHHLGPDSGWTVGSAGLHAGPGQPASAAAVAVLAEHGIDLRGHRSRPLTREMVDGAALVVVMTAAHAGDVMSRYPQARDRVRLLKSFDRGSGGGDISDPIGGGIRDYRDIREEIESALLDLIMHLRARGGRSG